MHRELWTRYWCRLHTFSAAPGSLLPLLRTFEDLLQECAPAVCLHLLRLELYPYTRHTPHRTESHLSDVA